MNQILKLVILVGIFLLPFINSRIAELLGFSFSMPVNGNFEFTKVMFFNIWSSIVIGLFFVSRMLLFSYLKVGQNLGGLNKKGKYCFPTAILFFYVILILSTYFSTSPYISFFGNEIKSHSFIMWSNLVGFFLVFSSVLNKKFFQQIITTLIFSGLFVSIIGLKEYFQPTFDYGDLGNRLFSTFGHPNYVSIFLVSLMPFLYQKLHLTSLFSRGITIATLSLFIITLFFTKSILAIFLFVCFSIGYFLSSSGKGEVPCNEMKGGWGYYWLFPLFAIIATSFFLFNFFPEKLHSFISRYFIWETAIKVIFSDIKFLLIGGGAETFMYFFNNFKSEYLYIFENIGFSADRPHNIIINFFYHFGTGGLLIILGLYYNVCKLLKTYKTDLLNKPELISLVIILFFLLLNPTSVVIYVLVIVLLAYITKSELTFNSSMGKHKKDVGVKKNIFKFQKINNFCGKSIFLIITIISAYGAYSSYKFYFSETKTYTNQLAQSISIFKYSPNTYFYTGNFRKGLYYSKLKTPIFYKLKIAHSNSRQQEIVHCNSFVSQYDYAEAFFYCGNYFWDRGNIEVAKKYYKFGLELLPDLWNQDSQYYNKFLVKYLKINGNRFLSTKYGLAQILERVGIINE